MKKLSLIVGALVALGGCGDDDSTDVDDVSDVPGVDMGTPMDEDLGTPPTGLSCQDRVPTSGFGAIPGRNMSGFTLQDCSGTDYSFYNEEFCSNEVTVISIAAGWCPPCIAESEQLEEEITDFYAGQGVRVIQIPPRPPTTPPRISRTARPGSSASASRTSSSSTRRSSRASSFRTTRCPRRSSSTARA